MVVFEGEFSTETAAAVAKREASLNLVMSDWKIVAVEGELICRRRGATWLEAAIDALPNAVVARRALALLAASEV